MGVCPQSFVEKNGIKYSKGSIVFCSIEDEVPVFGKIMDILVWSMGKCIFVIIPYVGDNFFNHYNAYEVRPDNSNYIFQTPDNLADHRTLSLSTSFSQH